MWSSRTIIFTVVALIFGSCARPPMNGQSVPVSTPELIVQRALPAPHVDGKCADLGYQRSGTLELGARAPAKVQFTHSGIDAYFCAATLSLGIEAVLVRVDPANGLQRQTAYDGICEFRIGRDGSLRFRTTNRDGSFVQTTLAAEMFSGAVERSATAWSAEMRIALEIFAGYGRVDHFQIELEETRNESTVWPAGSQRDASSSWGLLRLEPIYPVGINAGSLFFNGSGGHLVIPYSSALNPIEITIAMWVRVLNDGCATILGNGRQESYWLGICDRVVRFSPGPGTPLLNGARFLGSSWHHVAVTMNTRGTRVLYIDGTIDNAAVLRSAPFDVDSTPSIRFPVSKVRLKSGRSTLWMGGDREMPEEENYLHGHLQDVAIWNTALSPDAIRRVAISHPTVERQGLVSYWPLTTSLSDVISGHDAGLVGGASLAREAPMRQLAPVENPSAAPLKRAPIRVAWNGRIPFVDRTLKVDGVCEASEWQGGAKVRLEPGRLGGVRLIGTRDALYLCTEPLFGKGNDSIVFWIARDGVTRTQPGPNDLKFTIFSGGALETAVGNGTRFATQEIPRAKAATVHSDTWGWQDDEDRVHAPWWSSELEIPLGVLTPFVPGRKIRIGIRYQGSLSDDSAAKLRPGSRFSVPPQRTGLRSTQVIRVWPAPGPDDRPPTWGTVTTQVIVPASIKQLQSETEFDNPASVPPDPTVGDFNNACPYDDDDPGALPYTWDYDAKWPLVDLNHVIARTEGTLDNDSGISVSDEDSTLIHDSHDVDFQLYPKTSAAQGLMLSDGPTCDGGIRCQVLEVETAQLPPNSSGNQQARPDR